MRKAIYKQLLVGILVILAISLLTQVVKADSTTVYMDSMTTYRVNRDQVYCHNTYEIAREHNQETSGGRQILVFVGNLNSIPAGATIDSAYVNLYLTDGGRGSDDGKLYIYTNYRGESPDQCMACMSYRQALQECNIDTNEILLLIKRVDDGSCSSSICPPESVNLDITSYVQQSLGTSEKNMYFWVWPYADFDDDYIWTQFAGDSYSDASKRPKMTITYSAGQECTSGLCCDSDGNYKPSSYKCQENANIDYGCPWGTSYGQDVGVNYGDKYCSGSSENCDGSLVWGGWEVNASCGPKEVCFDDNPNCQDIDCFSSSDCGTEGWLNQQGCQSNDVYDYDRTYTCYNAGTTSASCSDPSDVWQFKTGCYNTTYDAWGPNYCSIYGDGGKVVHDAKIHERGCRNNECYYDPTKTKTETVTGGDCTYGCLNNVCAEPDCFNDDNCGAESSVGDPYCSGNQLHQMMIKGLCENDGSVYSSCRDSDPYDNVIDPCPYGCEDGNTACNTNIPPVVNDLTQSSSSVYRTDSISINCKVYDGNQNPSTLSPTIQYKSPSGSWTTLSHYYNGMSGSNAIFTATFTPSASAQLGTYDFGCMVTDQLGATSSWAYDYDVVAVNNHPPEFTTSTTDDSSQDSPTRGGNKVIFNANSNDPENYIKFLVCDSSGISGTSCANKEYCHDGFEPSGSKSCSYTTTNIESGSYNWYSYAVDELGTITNGASGTFYVANYPKNPNVGINNQQIWSYSGWFAGPETITNFDNKIIDAINSCTPDSENLCLIPITLHSDTMGILTVSDIVIYYTLYVNHPPQLNDIKDIEANEGQLVRITPFALEPDGDDIAYTFSSPLNLNGEWQTDYDDAGEYFAMVTVSDGKLTDSQTVRIKVIDMIDPDLGGVVEYHMAKIIIPPYAIPNSDITPIEISNVSEGGHMQENDLKVIGEIYNFEPDGIVFDKPVDVEIRYLDGWVENENSLDVFLYKEINGQWQWVAVGAELDTANNVLRFQLSHFSEYTIREVLYDDITPIITITSPEEKTYWHDDIVPIEFKVFDAKDINPDVVIKLNNNIISDTIIDISSLDVGSHTLLIEATDDYNNKGTSSVTFEVVDYTPPTTNDNAPEGWQNSGITIILTATDDYSGVKTTHYCVDKTDSCLPSTEGTSITINDEGTSYIRYYSTDNAGNEEQIKSVMVKIDKSSPETYDDAPDGWVNSNVAVTLTANDEYSGVKTIYYRINGGGWQEGTSIILTDAGEHTIEYYSVDNVGNEEEIKEANVKIDKTAPETTDDLSIDDWTNKDVIITLTCDDDLSGCNETEYCMQQEESPLCAGLFGNTAEISCSSTCKYMLFYHSTDNAGNEENSHKIGTIKIDKEAPTTTDNAPTEWQANDVTVTLTADDSDGSGVDKTYYCIDDEDICTPDNEYTTEIEVICEEVTVCNKFLRYFTVDNVGNEENINSVVVRIDKQKPSASDNYDGKWHTEDIVITLTPDDFYGSGVDDTYYIIYEDEEPQGTKILNQDGQPVITYEDNDNWLEYWTIDKVGNEEEHHLIKEIKLDKTYPETTDNHDEEWHNENIIITLEADDPVTGGTPSGVKEIYYIAYEDEAALEEQAVESDIAEVLIGYEDDNNKVEYWTVDAAGNEEEHIIIDNIKLDKTKPDVLIWLNPELELYNNTEPLPVHYETEDPQVQGTPSNNLEIVFDVDGIEVEDPTQIFNFACKHNLTITATDIAGNVNSASVGFEAILRLAGEEQLFITPETLKINPGVLTAHTRFPEPYNNSEIIDAYADGIKYDKISSSNIEFRREELEKGPLPLDTFFEVEGRFNYNGQECIFKGEDSITEILDNKGRK